MKYIHDEWCGTKLAGTECDCVVGTLEAKDEEIQYLKDMGEIMLAVIKYLREGSPIGVTCNKRTEL